MSIATTTFKSCRKLTTQQPSLFMGGLLQRKCDCGSPAASLIGQCEECKSKGRLQAKLTIGASNDPLEQEADRVADQVLAAGVDPAVGHLPPRIQRYAAQATGGTDTAPASVDRVLASSGRPLEPALKQDMEQRFGHDFSRVRVHSGAEAEQSAREVNAHAYTVGHNIVFSTGQFKPEFHEGRRLIAHELIHVIQQSGSEGISVPQRDGDSQEQGASIRAKGEVGKSGNAYEPTVQGSKMLFKSCTSIYTGAPRKENPVLQKLEPRDGTLTIMRQQVPMGSVATQPDALVERARASAWMRCFRAYTRVAGIGPPPPPGRSDLTESWQRQATHLARIIFRESLNMDQVADIVGAMRDRLGPNLQTVRATTGDRECGGLRDAYVVGNRSPVHLCPGFFRSSAEEQMKTMIHEAAHMAGIGEGSGNEYCFYADCESDPNCGGFNFADSWTQYVMCLSE